MKFDCLILPILFAFAGYGEASSLREPKSLVADKEEDVKMSFHEKDDAPLQSEERSALDEGGRRSFDDVDLRIRLENLERLLDLRGGGNDFEKISLLRNDETQRSQALEAALSSLQRDENFHTVPDIVDFGALSSNERIERLTSLQSKLKEGISKLTEVDLMTVANGVIEFASIIRNTQAHLRKVEKPVATIVQLLQNETSKDQDTRRALAVTLDGTVDRAVAGRHVKQNKTDHNHQQQDHHAQYRHVLNEHRKRTKSMYRGHIQEKLVDMQEAIYNGDHSSINAFANELFHSHYTRFSKKDKARTTSDGRRRLNKAEMCSTLVDCASKMSQYDLFVYYHSDDIDTNTGAVDENVIMYDEKDVSSKYAKIKELVGTGDQLLDSLKCDELLKQFHRTIENGAVPSWEGATVGEVCLAEGTTTYVKFEDAAKVLALKPVKLIAKAPQTPPDLNETDSERKDVLELIFTRTVAGIVHPDLISTLIVEPLACAETLFKHGPGIREPFPFGLEGIPPNLDDMALDVDTTTKDERMDKVRFPTFFGKEAFPDLPPAKLDYRRQLTTSRPEERRLSTSDLLIDNGYYGDWRGFKGSNPPFYACGAQMRFEDNQGKGDDTAGNGLKLLFCDWSNWNSQQWVTIDNGYWGGWKPQVKCSSGKFVDGAELRIEGTQGGGDDTALNGMRIHCVDKNGNGGETKSVYDGIWGNWRGMKTKAGWVVSEAEMRIEASQGGGDDTAWNGLKFRMSPRPTPSPTPQPTPSPTQKPTPSPTPQPTEAVKIEVVSQEEARDEHGQIRNNQESPYNFVSYSYLLNKYITCSKELGSSILEDLTEKDAKGEQYDLSQVIEEDFYDKFYSSCVNEFYGAMGDGIALVFGDKPSSGFICGIKESIVNDDKELPGTCCLDAPFQLDGDDWGRKYQCPIEGESSKCKYYGPYFSGMSTESCDSYGGTWCPNSVDCSTLSQCIEQYKQDAQDNGELSFYDYLDAAPVIQDPTSFKQCGSTREYFGYDEYFSNDKQVCEDIEQLQLMRDFSFIDEFYGQGGDAEKGDDPIEAPEFEAPETKTIAPGSAGQAPPIPEPYIPQLTAPDHSESEDPLVQSGLDWENAIFSQQQVLDSTNAAIETADNVACPWVPFIGTFPCDLAKTIVKAVLLVLSQTLTVTLKISEYMMKAKAVIDNIKPIKEAEQVDAVTTNMVETSNGISDTTNIVNTYIHDSVQALFDDMNKKDEASNEYLAELDEGMKDFLAESFTKTNDFIEETSQPQIDALSEIQTDLKIVMAGISFDIQAEITSKKDPKSFIVLMTGVDGKPTKPDFFDIEWVGADGTSSFAPESSFTVKNIGSGGRRLITFDDSVKETTFFVTAGLNEGNSDDELVTKSLLLSFL